MKQYKDKRNKAYLGAIIGAAASLIGSIGSGIISSNSQKKQIREQQRVQNRQDTLTMAQNLSAAYDGQDYADDYYKRITFKQGGKMKTKGDRITRAKRFACGGRKKAAWGAEDTTAIINSVGSALGNLANSAIMSRANDSVKKGDMFAGTPKTKIKKPDYLVDAANDYANYNIMLRCGGMRKRGRK